MLVFSFLAEVIPLDQRGFVRMTMPIDIYIIYTARLVRFYSWKVFRLSFQALPNSFVLPNTSSVPAIAPKIKRMNLKS